MRRGQVQANFTTGLKRRLKNYRVGMLLREVKNFILNMRSEINNLERRFISVKPKKPSRGRVLLCYVNKGFFVKPGQPVLNYHTQEWGSLNYHTNNWESLQI